MAFNNPQQTYLHTTFHPQSFWSSRRSTILHTTLPTQLELLRSTGRYDCFDLKWKSIYGDRAGPAGLEYPTNRHLFWDSDLAKWIEGVEYFFKEEIGKEMRARGDGEGREEVVLEHMRTAVEELVGKMEWAQRQGGDGYLNLHYMVVEKGKRFTNLRDMHELYNAGHLIEAAIIHSQGKDQRLLAVIERYTELIMKTFGPGKHQKHGYPGHPEIELSLIRLYKATGKKKYLDLAKYFIEERGQLNPHYYDVEARERGERPNERPGAWPERRAYWYQQAHKPLLEQDTVEGHSVRVMYLLAAAADLADLDDEFRDKYLPTIRRLWNNMVGKKMYLTGGVGAIDQWEGFGINYFLPQATDEGGCYAETCAGIGVMMWANRMLQLELDRKYSDILELCLYNCVLTGMSIDGKAFTYVNQLASSPGEPSRRYDWFDCACCPPNLARTMGFLAGYFWDLKEIQEDAESRQMAYELDFDYIPAEPSVKINVHLYSSCTLTQTLADGSILKLEQRTDWPWKGAVEFHLQTSNQNTTVRLRIPSWADEYKIKPSLTSAQVENGYLVLPPKYLCENSRFLFTVPMMPRLIKPHPYANQSITAVARGPIVYCIEDIDHPWVEDHFKSLVFPHASPANLKEIERSDLPGGEPYIAIRAPKSGTLLPQSMTDPLAGENGPSPFYSVNSEGQKKRALDKNEKLDLIFIPYYARANRGGKGMMRVGLRSSCEF